jgi:hypothetical protein
MKPSYMSRPIRTFPRHGLGEVICPPEHTKPALPLEGRKDFYLPLSARIGGGEIWTMAHYQFQARAGG